MNEFQEKYPPVFKEGAIASGSLNAAQQKLDKDSWVHRSDGMRCRTCIWFVRKYASDPKPVDRREVGRCRRHAPTMGGYPVVYQTDWCGDHRVDENKV